jgi:hypothetical protein
MLLQVPEFQLWAEPYFMHLNNPLKRAGIPEATDEAVLFSFNHICIEIHVFSCGKVLFSR